MVKTPPFTAIEWDSIGEVCPSFLIRATHQAMLDVLKHESSLLV